MVKRKCEGLDLDLVVSHLSRNLAGSLSDTFIRQEDNVSFLLDLIKRTADKGESNSLLVLGPHGVGKTALVRHTIALAAKSPGWLENVVVVQLNGLLQTDDKIALKEITKQLNLENVSDGRVFGSFAEHLSFLLASLKVGDMSSKPIIFILEEFDSFCSHKNQTLLYNLFDTAQSRAVPICVIGVSCQIDVTELLEKRVNSRFSHRHLNLMPSQEFGPFLELAIKLLLLEEASVPDHGDWNKMVETVMSKKDVKTFLETKVFAFDKSIANLKRILYLALLNMLEAGATKLNLEHMILANDENFSCERVDSCELLIRDLSIVELCLLVAVKHLADIYDSEPFNFEMVYHQYVKFKRQKCTTLPEDRSVVFKCWEQLLELELVLPRLGDRVKSQQLEYILNSFQLSAEALRKGVEKYPHCPTELLQWVKSDLHTSSH